MPDAPGNKHPPTAPATSPLAATLELARRGNRSVLAQLRQALDADPALWRQYGDLTRLLEQAWIERVGGPNLLLTESLRCAVEQMRTDLAVNGSDGGGGGGPNALERLLIDRVIASWLATQAADLALAVAEGEGPQVTRVRTASADAAHRRFLAAGKTLATVRRLTAGISIRVEHTVNAAATAAGAVASERDVKGDGASGGRLGPLIDELDGATPVAGGAGTAVPEGASA